MNDKNIHKPVFAVWKRKKIEGKTIFVSASESVYRINFISKDS
jgi:hypothetical protein